MKLRLRFTGLLQTATMLEILAGNYFNHGFRLFGPGDSRETQPRAHGTQGKICWWGFRTPHPDLGDNCSDTPQQEAFGRQQLLKEEMHLPSRSFSGVSAVYQSEGGPVPFTVMAATWKLYWLPFSSPV